MTHALYGYCSGIVYSSSIPQGGGGNNIGTFSWIWGRILRIGTKRPENVYFFIESAYNALFSLKNAQNLPSVLLNIRR